MSYLSPGLLEAYNSLTDKHLIGYFNNTRIRRHLRRAGLITRSGRIVPEKEYRQKLIHRAHQRHVRECLAQAIFHKVLDMERAHQTEIKKRLEEFARRERVYKIKVERSKRHDDDFIPMLSPRPPTGPRGNHTQQSGPEGDMSESTESPGSSRPNTAPGKMQRPVRLKPIDRNNTTASVKRTPPSSRNQDSSNDTDQPASLDRDMRHWSMREYNNTVSPYRLPVINNYVTPVPPQTKRRERGMRGTLNGTRGRRLRPTTAPTTPANMEDSALLRTSVQSKVTVTMVYFGRSVHLSHDLMDLGDEVKAFQQHCGGENLCVYKGRLREGETFQFISRRHRGFPFSLTFYLNGLQVDRLSSCCEFKHRKGSRLGGRHGHFGFFSVDGAQPCYKCIIAMGLDKKPTPPPKRVSDDTGSSQAIELCPESTQEPAEMQEDQVERTEPETETESTQPHSLKTEEEAMQDDQPKDDYEEDFEADDEGPVEDGGEEADGKSPSPTNEGKTEDEIQDAPEGETTEHNKHPAGEAEDEDKTDRRETRSVSSGAASSSSGSDAEDSEDEAKTKEADAAETAKTSEVALQQAEPETELPLPMETSDKDQQVEDAETMEVSSPVPTDTEAAAAVEHTQTQDSAGDSLDKTELEVSESTEVETAAAAAAVDEGTADPTGGSAAENEPERAKSVQEKLAEAILSEAHSSPEPELSDTSTEEEEEVSSEKTPQDTSVVEPETGMALSLLQPEKGPDKECEEGLKEISNEETGTLAGEERGPSPENKEKEATDGQNLEAAEEPGVENEKTAEPEERVEPMDESSKVPLQTPAAPDCEKKEKEEMESTEAAETPGEAEIESEKKDQDIEENAKEQTEESSTIANETESADPENKEGVAEEMKETKDSEAPLEQQEKEEEGIEDSEETGEGEPVMSETEAHKTSEEPSESVAVVSEVAQSEEPSADDTKGEEGTPDDQNGVAESGTARADDATTHDATVLDDSTSADKSTVQEPDSCIVQTSEKTSDTDIVGKENEENCEETLVDGKNIESDENTVKDGNDEQNTEEKDKAEEEKPDNVDERHSEVQQENESAAMDKEDRIVDELREDKDTLVEAVENVEAVQEQATLDTGEQLEEDKVEEEAKEVDIKEDRHTENEVKSVGEDAKTSVSDGEKEKSEVEEEKNNTADRAVDGDERNSVSEGEKEKSVEGEKNRNMDVRESEDQEAKSEKDEPEGQEAKGEKEDTIVETIAEKETNKVTEKEIEADECGQGGDKVKDEEVDKPVNEQVDEREVEAEQTRKENEKEEDEEKEVKGSQDDEDQVQCADKDNTKDRESGDSKTVDGAEEGSAPQDERSKVDDKARETLKDDNTDTKVEEAERSEKDAAESIERNDSKTFDGEREISGGREEDRKEEADNCGGDGDDDDDDARSEKKEQRNENESETDRDVKGEDKDDVMVFNMETTIQDKAVSRDGTESQQSENAEADGKVEVRIKRTPVFEFAITEQDKTEINDENGEKITASETNENEVKTSELGSEEPCQIVDKEQSGSSDRGEEEVTGTRIEEIVGDKQNDIEDINGDDAKSDRKLSSDGSAATQVKVEERKVKMVADVPDGSDDRTSVQSKTSKDSLSRHSSTKQDTDAANNDKKVEEASTEIEPFHFVQEIEGLNAVHTNAKVSDVPESTGSNPETKWHKQRPKDLEGKEDTSTKTGSREPDGTDKEHKEHKVNGEQSVAESLTSPLPLEREEVGDLVSKWVNQHQTRGCFQTFVEPLDDMKETSSLSKGDGHMNGHTEKGEGSQATNMPESDTLDQMSEKKEDYSSPPMSALTEDKQETAVEDFVMETGEEKAESDVRDKHSSDESALATKDMSKDGQDNEIRDLKLTDETKYAKKDTTSIATKDWENRPYEQGVLSDKVINQIAITKIKDDSKPDSESSSESASNAKRDNSVHSGHTQDTTMTKQQLKLEDVMPQSLSRDRLNTFSVEDSHLFGPTTYPRLATAHPEQSY